VIANLFAELPKKLLAYRKHRVAWTSPDEPTIWPAAYHAGRKNGWPDWWTYFLPEKCVQ